MAFVDATLFLRRSNGVAQAESVDIRQEPFDANGMPMVIDQEKFKKAVSRFISGVGVMTTNVDGDLTGVTVSSFASVSLDPPLVSFYIASTSPSAEVFLKAERFAVNILSTTQAGVARQFATKRSNRFEGISLLPGKELPIIRDVTTWMICEKHSVHVLGDHHLVVGRVTEAGGTGQAPLAYWSSHLFNLWSETPLSILSGLERDVKVTWILASDGHIALKRASNGKQGSLTLPSETLSASELSRGVDQLSEGNLSKYSKVLEDPHLQALFSVAKDDIEACFRARLAPGTELDEGYELHKVRDIPWERLSDPAEEKSLRRYITERSNDRHGVYLSKDLGQLF